jgi:hypothetical protein
MEFTVHRPQIAYGKMNVACDLWALEMRFPVTLSNYWPGSNCMHLSPKELSFRLAETDERTWKKMFSLLSTY